MESHRCWAHATPSPGLGQDGRAGRTGGTDGRAGGVVETRQARSPAVRVGRRVRPDPTRFRPPPSARRHRGIALVYRETGGMATTALEAAAVAAAGDTRPASAGLSETPARARSSVGQSVGLLSRGSGVRIPPGAPAFATPASLCVASAWLAVAAPCPSPQRQPRVGPIRRRLTNGRRSVRAAATGPRPSGRRRQDGPTMPTDEAGGDAPRRPSSRAAVPRR